MAWRPASLKMGGGGGGGVHGRKLKVGMLTLRLPKNNIESLLRTASIRGQHPKLKVKQAPRKSLAFCRVAWAHFPGARNWLWM